VTTVDRGAVADAVAATRRRIEQLAGDRVVELIAVTKGFGADAIEAAAAAGCAAIGENYAQELVAKLGEVDAPPTVHFIGQLQSNKVRALAGIVDVWQTIDRASLADEIARRAPAARGFVQVNTTGEIDKGGCRPDETAALVAHCRDRGLVVQGLMTVGPTSGDVAGTRAAFAMLRRLADELDLPSCSMGMSGDFEVAIELGATHVRIGSALFGDRPQRRPQIG
jgi:pyridoxal phosphate enzyme (YggS family)